MPDSITRSLNASESSTRIQLSGSRMTDEYRMSD